MSDGADTKPCLVTGAILPVSEMLRFCAGPAGEVAPDLSGKLPGDGFYVGGERNLVAAAVAKQLFCTPDGQKLTAPAALADQVEALLVAQVSGRLGLARKAGALELGFEKVASALRGGTVKLVITASDAAADGAGKLATLARRTECPVVTGVSSEILSLALGRPNVIHAAIVHAGSRGGWAKRVQQDINRLTRYRSGSLGSDVS